MTKSPDDWDDYAIQAARAAGLELTPEARALVVWHLEVLAGHAARVMGEPIHDEVEPAPVFQP